MATAREATAGADNGSFDQFDAIVIGAGVSGLYQLYRLRQLGPRCEHLRKAAASAAPGIGIATRVLASIRRATPMAIRS